MSRTARDRRDRKRAYCQSVVISEIILRDAFHAAGAARQAGANHYRARLALLPGESRPKHRDAQTHWFLAEFERSTRYKGTETLSEKERREAPAVSSSLRACITKFILQADCCTQAGWRQAACSQAASNVGANRNGEVLVCAYVLRYSFAFGSGGRPLARRHHPRQQKKLVLSSNPLVARTRLRPALPNVAGSRDGGPVHGRRTPVGRRRISG